MTELDIWIFTFNECTYINYLFHWNTYYDISPICIHIVTGTLHNMSVTCPAYVIRLGVNIYNNNDIVPSSNRLPLYCMYTRYLVENIRVRNMGLNTCSCNSV